MNKPTIKKRDDCYIMTVDNEYMATIEKLNDRWIVINNQRRIIAECKKFADAKRKALILCS